MFKDINEINETVDELDAIKNSITNILMTPRGSLPGKPNFGSDLSKVIFSPLDGLITSVAKNYVRESLDEFEPRITLKKIQIKGIEEYNKVVIDIYFSYKNVNGINNESTSIPINL